MRHVRKNLLIGVIAVATIGLSTEAAHANHTCSVSISGVDVRGEDGCEPTFHTDGYLRMTYSGYAFAVMTCNGSEIANTGLRHVNGTGVATVRYRAFGITHGIQFGGTCVLEVGTNGSASAFAN